MPRLRREASEELKKMSSDVLLLVMRCCMENSVVAKMWMLETYKVCVTK